MASIVDDEKLGLRIWVDSNSYRVFRLWVTNANLNKCRSFKITR